MKNLTILLFIWISTTATAQNSAPIYIENYKESAIRLMNAHGIPASVVLAVAMHESANGNSKIARNLNNHFGIKGKNSSTKIKSAYRGFESVDSGYEYFASLLKDKRQFRSLFEKYSHYDYKSWVMGIQRGGYAASRTWANQVMATIKKYRLYEFDNRPEAETQPVVTASDDSFINSTFKAIYRVKSGDTLVKIAKKLGTSVKAIMFKNSLKSSNLRIGQQLKI